MRGGAGAGSLAGEAWGWAAKRGAQGTARFSQCHMPRMRSIILKQPDARTSLWDSSGEAAAEAQLLASVVTAWQVQLLTAADR